MRAYQGGGPPPRPPLGHTCQVLYPVFLWFLFFLDTLR